MGLIDRWLNRFLHSDLDKTSSDVSLSSQAFDRSSEAAANAKGVGGEMPPDPLDAVIAAARARLTLSDAGRRYAEGAEFGAELSVIDAGGRGRAADALLADALLVTPSVKLRRQLTERLLHRGDIEKAQALLEQLKDIPEQAAFALTQLGELYEAKADNAGALRCYERVLATDITNTQAKTRARRLRAERGHAPHGKKKARHLLTRFLGARAAGSRYAVVEEIGRGGAATVFRAQDRLVPREVALKIYHPRGAAAQRRQRLLQEARLAGHFDHPNIVPILDVDEERDMLVMSLCNQGSLRQRLANGRLSVAESIEIGTVLLRTLADVHQRGQLHLDVKPSNLLFHDGRVLLCDFGTAGLQQTAPGAGTRAFMAPEQRAGQPPDARADLYAAGLVLTECFTGQLTTTFSAQEQNRPTLQLDALTMGPQRRGLQWVLQNLSASDKERRPKNGEQAADLLLSASALPRTDKEGVALLSHLSTLAARKGEEATARIQSHPLLALLQPTAAPAAS